MISKTIPLTAILFVVSSLSIANVSYVVEADEGINYERDLSALCESGGADQFEYDTQISLVPHRPSSRFYCTEDEMDEIGQQLTIAQQGVLSLGDPRLSSIIEILSNVCENPDVSQGRRLSFESNGYGFAWGSSSRCRYCPFDDKDDDTRIRNLREWVPSYFDDTMMSEARRLEQQKGDGIRGLVLWNTDDNHDDAGALRNLTMIDRIDLANYGSSLILEAQTSGDVAKVVFDIDDTVGFVDKVEAPFLFEHDVEAGPSLADVGQHTITATPYSSSGKELTPVTYLLQVIDTSTMTTAQGRRGLQWGLQSEYTREELVMILEWDLTYYLTAETHLYFYPMYGHCLYRKYVWMVVDLEEVVNTQCATDVNCGGHLAASCEQCPPEGMTGGQAASWCNGQCDWSGSQCIEGSSTTTTVSCGGHSASSCAECPSGHGAAWCNGECFWSNILNECVGG